MQGDGERARVLLEARRLGAEVTKLGWTITWPT